MLKVICRRGGFSGRSSRSLGHAVQVPTALPRAGASRLPNYVLARVWRQWRHARRVLHCSCAFVVLLWFVPSARAEQFGVSATVQKSPPQITLSWDAVPYGAASYTVYRSTAIGGYAGGGGIWTATASGLTATSYVDNNVVAGIDYEYRIGRTGSQFDGNAYLATGIEVPFADSRGKIVLMVDNTYASSLAGEISQLINDMTGDGWFVLRHDVSRTATPASVRSLIQTDAYNDPAAVRAVYLLGRVPVLRAGSLNPDDHAARPMPADGFYGDVDGSWSNPSYLPSDVDLQVGRVDLYNMPSFLPLTDTDLLRQYLNRAHGWKHKQWSVPARQAEMTTLTGDTIQRQFFGAVPPTDIPNNYYAGNGFYSPEFWNEVQNNDYLWFTKGSGGGDYTACTGMGSTYHYAASSGVKTVFNAEFASFFEEWDVADNFLRAPLAAKGSALTDVWSENPTWVLMHMAMGKSIGFSTRVSQNNSTYYNIPSYPGLINAHRGVHLALMGDPTLRQHITAPPANLNVSGNTSSAGLNWSASPDSSLLGYAIYRSSNATGPFARLNSSLVTGLNYTDATVAGGSYTYLVRAVKLEITPSGSYQNPSQGIFATFTPGGGSPDTTLIASAAPVSFTVTYSAANFVWSSLSPQDITLNQTGTATGTVSVSGTGNIRTVTVSAITGTGTLGISVAPGTALDTSGNSYPAAGPSSTFEVNAARAQITQIKQLSSGTIHMEFLGSPSSSYLIQANTSLSNSNWITLDTRVATWQGTFQYDDTGAATNARRYYRTANQ